MTKHSFTNLIFIIALVWLCILRWYHPFPLYVFGIVLLLYSIVIFIGCYFIDINFFMQSRNRGGSASARIALTFDDGPNEHTAKVLDILKAENAPATFFIIGQNIVGREALLERIDREGHAIGGHSWSHHWRFPLRSRQQIIDEITDTQASIFDITGRKTDLFRPPFGVTSLPLAAAVRHTRVTSIGWSLRSYDTVVSHPDKLMERLRRVKGGDIVLLHEAGICTPDVLPMFIKYIRTQGFEIVPLAELLKINEIRNASITENAEA